MGCAVVLRTVNRAMNWVALAHHGGQAADQLQILGGGNRGAAGAKAVVTLIGNGHNLKAGEGIIELSTCTWARPWASSGTTGCHSSKVSNNSRVLLRPPPPPGAAAFSP